MQLAIVLVMQKAGLILPLPRYCRGARSEGNPTKCLIDRIAALEAENLNLAKKHLESLQAEKDWANLYSKSMDAREQLEAEKTELCIQFEALDAENKRFEKQIQEMRAVGDRNRELFSQLRNMQEAGDSMCEEFGCRNCECECLEVCQFKAAWNAAKDAAGGEK